MSRNENVVQSYQAPAEKVDAIRFRGWQNADTIRKWAEDVFYVPRGYDHHLRVGPSEHDRSNGHIMEGAPEFLVVKGYGGDQRADVGDWIVRIEGDDGNGTESVEFRVFGDEDFNQSYTQPNLKPMQVALDNLFSVTGPFERADYHDDYNILAEALGLAKK